MLPLIMILIGICPITKDGILFSRRSNRQSITKKSMLNRSRRYHPEIIRPRHFSPKTVLAQVWMAILGYVRLGGWGALRRR